MKLLGSVLYHIFVVLGWSLLISKVLSRLLGVKEKEGDKIVLHSTPTNSPKCWRLMP